MQDLPTWSFMHLLNSPFEEPRTGILPASVDDISTPDNNTDVHAQWFYSVGRTVQTECRYTLRVRAIQSLQFILVGHCTGPDKRETEMAAKSSLPIVDSELRDTVNLTKLNTKCKKVTPAIVVKTIRLRMRELTELLLRMSDVKVVHLLRDPRAIQLSRKEMPDHFTSMGTLGPHKICNPMYEDLVASQRLVELFGANRIMQLTYDELVNHQDSVIRKLKNFANIYIDPILAKRFHRVTHGKAKVTGGFETGHPRNAELNIDRWKTELSPAEIEQFTEYNNCKPIFDLIQARVANIKGPRYSNGRVNRSRHRDLFVKVD
ncbi:uncharacterized protein LOC142339247 isoform X2 [Convolutriloba macropyga]|uniref:uncharacterized protein LOC142339247 isoform X2 n=1 Tax=Convolutriloba macropyga TaxID=536237 RepID=UPI003F526347